MSRSGRKPVAGTTTSASRVRPSVEVRVTAAVGRCEGRDAEAGVQFDGAGLDEAAEPGAELAAGGEPVGVAAAVDLVGRGAADGPDDPGPGHLGCELGEVEQGVGGRVARADHDGGAAGERVTVATEDVGQR